MRSLIQRYLNIKLVAGSIFIAVYSICVFYVYRHSIESRDLRYINGTVTKSLNQTFYPLWDDAKNLGSSDAVSWTMVRVLKNKYNQNNKGVYLVKIGDKDKMFITDKYKKFRRRDIALELSGYNVNATVIVTLPNKKNYVLLLYAITLFIGLLLIIKYPQFRQLDRHVYAKIYGAIFDRKVSSKKPWGSWQLTHLGSGSRLVNISPNGYKQANDRRIVNQCIDGMSIAIKLAGEAFGDELNRIDGWKEERLMLNQRLEDIRETMKSSPIVSDESDVPKFVEFVRDVALRPVVIDVTRLESFETIPHCDLNIGPYSNWITDGYYIFMRRETWDNILQMIHDGLRNAYGVSIESINVFSKDSDPYINMDFMSDRDRIDQRNLSRLKQYIKSPYRGDLDDLAKLISPYGKLIIMDSGVTVDVSDKKIHKYSNVKSLTVRLKIRRILKEERDRIAKSFDYHYSRLHMEG